MDSLTKIKRNYEVMHNLRERDLLNDCCPFQKYRAYYVFKGTNSSTLNNYPKASIQKVMSNP